MAAEILYRLYEQYYRSIDSGMTLVRDLYGASNLTDAGIGMMTQQQFAVRFSTMESAEAGMWLARMLRDSEHRWHDIETAIGALRNDVAQLRRGLNGAAREAA